MQKILITGARSGFMKSALNYLKDKFYIYLSVHTESEYEYIKKKYQNIKTIECLKLDVTYKEDLKKIKDLDIDILILNSAVSYGGSIYQIKEEDIKENFDVNVFGNLNIIKIVTKNMLLKKHGKIIIVSSMADTAPMPFLGIYAATKASLTQIGKALYYELLMHEGNYSVSLIKPGLYKTGFNKKALDNINTNDYLTEIQNKIEGLKKIYLLFERKNLNKVGKTIYQICLSKRPKLTYYMPLSQKIILKLYNLLN